ncbi:putative viral structural protein [Sulfolobales Beppu filamentous virus 2]|uniref:Putative viral structural protein n=1 Tax=Sulfolobales Beppu filamentous virus 2 TaxID=2493123 RepID=A0A3S8NEX2_9VIRU|nr:putative viral structural protein [Sulfolobales Beppu filamentous virus 2]AZI75785.1 putative viral structural protein [Sulfolobales Beppu filamentous virus 2]
MEFRKLEKPIKITHPIKAEFNEIWVSSDVRWNFFLSVIESIRTYFNTPDAITLFALREFLQNAIDQEIVKTGDLQNAYKKVKFEYMGKYYVIESEGDLPEEAFELGYTTKLNVKLPGRCCLIGRFGIGFKQAIGALKQQGYNVIIETNGHIYMYAGVCGEEVKINDITGDCRIAILKGESKVKGKTIVYAQGAELSTNLLWESPLRVSPTGKKVYHNGLYSGSWDLPFSVNVCCVYADEYRTRVTPGSVLMSHVIEDFYQSLTKEEREMLIKSIKDSAVVQKDFIYFDYPKSYNLYFTCYDEIAEAIVKLAKDNGIDIIVIGNEYEAKYAKTINVKPFIFNGILSSNIKALVDAIRKKGYKAYAFSEYKDIITKTALIKYSVPWEKLPDPVKAGILAGKWVFNSAYKFVRNMYNITRMSDVVKDTPIYVLSDQFEEWNRTDLGLTRYEEVPYIFLAPVKILEKVGSKYELFLYPSSPEERLFFVTMSVTFHELIHAVDFSIDHGTYQWDEYFNSLLIRIKKFDFDLIFLSNVINLAYYNYPLLENVWEITGLDEFYVEPDVFVQLRSTNTVYGIYTNNEFKMTGREEATMKLTVEKSEGVLKFKLESIR